MKSTGISTSFSKLRRLAETFNALPTNRESVADEKRAVRLVKDLGATAVPLLERKLRAADDSQASWAYFLLCRAASERAVAAARALALDDAASDAKKALALALLLELGADLPDDITLVDPEGVAEGSVRELVDSLTGPAEVARAAAILVDQVAPPELAGFVANILEVAGSEALPLLDEFLLRDDLDPAAAMALVALRAEHATTERRRAGRAPGVEIWLGVHADGRRAVLIATRAADLRRGLLLRIDADGELGRARYSHDLTAGGVRRLRERLVDDDYVMQRARRTHAADVVARAARATRAAQSRLPREYFLGRDLLGLHDEHLLAERRAEVPTLLVANAFELLDSGNAAGARRLAEKLVAAAPDDADARSCLGACLLELGDSDGALVHFAAAARAEPDALRHWNHSHAAKQANRLGACYLALVEYMRCRAKGQEGGEGAPERLRAAREYMKLFEKYARLEHPDATPVSVARAEELFDRAFQHMSAGRTEDAVTGFEAVLKLVPSHYPSWGNLGAAYLRLRRRDEAEHCLKKALEFRPDYEIARQNLASLRD